MRYKRTINIDGRVYWRNPEVDRYQIPIQELGELRLFDIPAHSHVEILGLPVSNVDFEFYLFGVNGGDEGEEEWLDVYGGASVIVQEHPSRPIARLRRAFPEMQNKGILPNPAIGIEQTNDGIRAYAHLDLDFRNRGHTLFREAIAPFIQGFRQLCGPEVRLFICHASEDKPKARNLAVFMRSLGADVWFDEWEIKVGDSIVQKINGALGAITHLVLLLSQNSINKPWVFKEFSSALMRQLLDHSITVLPVRIDNSPIPPILADIRYADARYDIEHAFHELEQSLFPDSSP